MEARLAEIDQRENRLVDLLADQALDAETFRRQQTCLRADRDQLFAQLQAIQQEVDGAYLFTAQRLLELAENAKSMWQSRSPEEKRDLLAELLENLELDGDTVRYRLRKPFAVLAEMREMKAWRARQDSNLRPPDS